MFNVRLTALSLALMASLTGCNTTNGSSDPVDVKIIAFNDFHGNLKSPGTVTVADPADVSKTIKVPAGGAEALATWISNLKAKNPNHVVVTAGDLIGGSPLLSALFHDEPTIESMNMMGLDFNAVGNHEFDDGKDELLRMQNGGCHPVDGCQSGVQFTGAKFKFLAANVVDSKSSKTLFPAYQIKTFNNIPVAFIGMTLKGTPTIVTPSGVAGLDFKDEAETVNKLVPELKAQGVEAIVVLVHEGGMQTGDYNECKGIAGPIVDIVNKFDKAVDIVVTGHTHQAYNCNINGKLVTSAMSFGRLLTEIDIKLDPHSRDITEMKAANLIVKTDVAKNAQQTSLIDRIAALVKPLENRVIGMATAKLDNTANVAGESSLGDVIADSQLDATMDGKLGGAQIAFMNPGGIRTAITPDASGNVTYGQLFTTQPFGNNLVTMTVKGSEIKELLEQQWKGGNQVVPKVLQVSSGFTYTWDANKPLGERVEATNIKLNGVMIDPAGSYRITVNNFLSTGGDNFTVLNNGTNRLGGVVDLDALESYFKSHVPVAPGKQNRISRLN
ncbi:bifunctional metallophosphatase/5'-nucleotidase [Chitinivorax sp. B]|uniref:bifunctional metallophosphatase/5'-nucleotidase n=1 Tax=Chitinivorax sp. B TaxID=2502235 RepID=UPI0010F725D6|nr:bifunctional metallophosphatase/5'-nucleotidase [Chitinivorax sp. B]